MIPFTVGERRLRKWQSIDHARFGRYGKYSNLINVVFVVVFFFPTDSCLEHKSAVQGLVCTDGADMAPE